MCKNAPCPFCVCSVLAVMARNPLRWRGSNDGQQSPEHVAGTFYHARSMEACESVLARRILVCSARPSLSVITKTSEARQTDTSSIG